MWHTLNNELKDLYKASTESGPIGNKHQLVFAAVRAAAAASRSHVTVLTASGCYFHRQSNGGFSPSQCAEIETYSPRWHPYVHMRAGGRTIEEATYVGWHELQFVVSDHRSILHRRQRVHTFIKSKKIIITSMPPRIRSYIDPCSVSAEQRTLQRRRLFHWDWER